METHFKTPNLVELTHCNWLQMFSRTDGQLTEVVLSSTVYFQLSVVMGQCMDNPKTKYFIHTFLPSAVAWACAWVHDGRVGGGLRLAEELKVKAMRGILEEPGFGTAWLKYHGASLQHVRPAWQ